LIKNNQLKDRLIYPYFYPYNLDWTLQFRHAPARRRVAANMFGLARGYAAICLLRPLWLAEGATMAGCGVRLIVQP